MTSLKSISMSELTKDGGGLGVVKSGVGNKFVDLFELKKPYPVEFTAEKITYRPSGTPQVQLDASMMQEDGGLVLGGRVWIELPILAPGSVDLTAEEEAKYLQKSGEKFVRFLRAIDPERFVVFANIDKSDPKQWQYLDRHGQPMSEDVRLKLAEQIDAAVVRIAKGIVGGTISLVGTRCIVTKQPNSFAPGFPYANFTAFPTE